jgi:hypothetical protein
MPTLVIIQILEKSSLKQKEKASHENCSIQQYFHRLKVQVANWQTELDKLG